MPYAPIISGTDLETHIYKNIQDQISRNNDSIIASAIDAGIAEAKIYLSRYDLVAMFGSAAEDTAATFSDPYLTNLVKDLICWQLISLGNPNLLTEHRRKRYEDAVSTLKLIQKGQANPEWPYIDSTLTTAPNTDAVTIYANDKRENYY